MQSWRNDIVIDRLEQIREAISLINEWCKGYATEDDFLCSPTGMAMLDASILRLQIIGESVRAIDDKLYAFDLCCPHEGKRDIRLTVDGFFATCGNCGSSFEIGNGTGYVNKGPSKQPLKRYNVYGSYGELYRVGN